MTQTNQYPNYPPGSTLPKSIGRIRKTLKLVSNANEPSQPGPVRQGLGKTDWVVARCFKKKSQVWFCKVLQRHRINYRLRRSRDEVAVEVRYPDLGAALRLFENFRAISSPESLTARNRTVAGIRSSMSLAAEKALAKHALVLGGIGAIVGVVYGFVVVATSPRLVDATLNILISIGVCVISGILLGVAYYLRDELLR